MNESNLQNDINSYICKNAEYYREFYVGITSNPTKRLFEEHNVSENNDVYIYIEADSEEIARAVEKHFIDKGCKGDQGGGTYPRHVYAYKISSNTSE